MEKFSVYHKLKSELLQGIKDGSIPVGSRLPGENALAAEYKISRPSVRKALLELESANLIRKIPGKGTFVLDGRAPVSPGRFLTIGVDFLEPVSSSDWYYGEIIRGVKQACSENQCRLTVVRKEELAGLPSGFVDGLITMRCGDEDVPVIEDLHSKGVPSVMINRCPVSSKIGYIRVDYREEARKAVTHILKTGHRRIAVISERRRVVSSDSALNPRILGMKAAHQDMGVVFDDNLLFASQSPNVVGELAAFLRETECSAIFITSGAMLNHFFQAASLVDRARFEDFFILCFDNVQKLAKESGFTVSEINMPLEEMGRSALEYLVAKMREGDECPVLRDTLSASLVIKTRNGRFI